MELFVEAGNYAAYQRAYASRYGQLDGLSATYPNGLMLPPASHSLLPPSNMPSSAIDGYYQQVLQSGLNVGLAGPYGNMFTSPHRPMPMMHPMQNTNAFLPLNPQNNFYPSSTGLPNATSPLQRLSPEQMRANSISPAASSLSSHSPKESTVTAASRSSPVQQTKPADDESDIEV